MTALAYFITFRTYATWLTGDERGSVDAKTNRYGSPFIKPNKMRAKYALKRANALSFEMDQPCIECVDRTIREVCAHRSWSMHALNVRTNHVHIVVSGAASPERMMTDFKSWSTRRLRENGLVDPSQPVWARHGSTRHLFFGEALTGAIRYAMLAQGDSLIDDAKNV